MYLNFLAPMGVIQLFKNFETVEYICDTIHNYFNKYNYDIIIDYNKPLITFIYNTHKCDITINNLFDGSLYWILTISQI